MSETHGTGTHVSPPVKRGVDCHRVRRIFVLASLLVLVWTGGVQAQTASQRNFIVGMYQSYFQRDPTRANINEWLGWFQRGSSAEEIHASFIASDELFARMNRDSDRWLSYVFQVVVGRNPTAQEFNYWRGRYRQLRQDRRAFGLEFLNSMGNRRPSSGPSQPSNALESLGGQVYSQSRSLRSAIISEFSNNATVLRLQANTLVSAASKVRSATAQRESDIQQIRQAIIDAQSAFLGVQAGLRGQYGGFQSQLFLNQVKETLNQLAVGVGIQGGGAVNPSPEFGPPIGLPGWPSPDRPGGNWQTSEWISLTRLTRELSSEVHSLYYLLQSLARTDYRYQSLAGDMQLYAARVNDFSNAINDNIRRGRLRRMLGELQNASADFTRRIAGQRVDVRLRQGLFQVDLSLAKLQSIVGGGNAGGPGIPPSYPAAPDYRQLLIEVDRAIAECDRLIAIYSTYVIFGRPVQVYLADLRTVRQQLQVLRAVAVSKNEALVRSEVSVIVEKNSKLQQPWTQMRRTVSSSNAADMNGLNSAVSRIQALVN